MLNRIVAVFQNIDMAEKALAFSKKNIVGINKAVIKSSRNYYAVSGGNSYEPFMINGNGVLAGLDAKEISAYSPTGIEGGIFVGNFIKDYKKSITRDIILTLYIEGDDGSNLVFAANKLLSMGAVSVNYDKSV